MKAIDVEVFEAEFDKVIAEVEHAAKWFLIRKAGQPYVMLGPPDADVPSSMGGHQEWVPSNEFSPEESY